MFRSVLVALTVAALALAGLAIRRQLTAPSPGDHTAQLPAESRGVLTADARAVPFTLYWPEGEAGPVKALVIFAADAHAEDPRPFRAWARAAAAAGVAAAYLEPSDAPLVEAERLRTVLEHHAELLGIRRASVWTWVEGVGVRGRHAPEPTAPCGRVGVLSEVLARAERQLAGAGHLVERAVDFTVNTRCPLAGMR